MNDTTNTPDRTRLDAGALAEATATASTVADDASKNILHFRQFTHWTAWVAFSFGGVEVLAFFMLGDRWIGAAGAVTLGYGGCLLVARELLRRSRLQAAVRLSVVGMLLGALLVALVLPIAIPALTVLTIVAVALALPDVRGRTINIIILAAWLTGVLLTFMGDLLPSSSELPAWVSQVFRMTSIPTALALVLLLLTQFASRLNDTLGKLQAINASLQAEIAERKKIEAQMKEAEAFVTSLLENAPMPIYVHSTEGHSLLVNRAAEEAFHRSRDEMLGRSVTDIFPAENARILLETNQRVMNSAAPLTYESLIQTPGGTRYFQTVKFPVRDARGAIKAVGGLSIDVTERKRAEEALQTSEERYRNLVENINDIYYVADPLGRLVYGSPNLFSYTGYTARELIGKSYARLVARADRQRVVDFYQEHASRGTLDVTCEFGARRKDGQTIWVEQATRIIRDQQGAVLEYRNVVRDISERKRAAEEIHQQTARAEALARTAARLNAQLDLVTVLNAVCEETARAMNVPAAALRLYDPRRDELHVASSYGLPHAFSAFKPSPRSLYDELIDQQGDLLVAPDVQALANVPNRDFYAAFNIRTVVTAMMQRGSQLIGGLSIFTLGDARPFCADELALLRGLANQAAQAIVNAQLFDETQRRLGRLRALRSIDTAITASVDLNFTLNRVLEEVTTQLQVDAADILQFNEHEHLLQYAAGQGFHSSALKYTRLQLGEGYAGTAALERRMIKVPVLTEAIDGLARAPLLPAEDFVTYYAVPLLAKGQIKGVLEVFHRTRLDAGEEWEEFLEALAGQTAIAIDNAELFDNLQRSNLALRSAYEATLEGWSRALDLRDKETEGHTQRVTALTLRLARVMGIGDAELMQVRRGALLHDIGKMGIPDHILLKPGPLTDEEWSIMRQHPTYAYQLLYPIAYLRPALDIPYGHHEKWDGTGYPRGLKGQAIPMAARIFAVVDVWDALRSDRPYRAGWPEAKVREHIQSLAGTHFDPQIVEMFLAMEMSESTA